MSKKKKKKPRETTVTPHRERLNFSVPPSEDRDMDGTPPASRNCVLQAQRRAFLRQYGK